MKKTVIITGCSSGFGRLAAQTFHRHGWNVVATMRAPERESELTRVEGILVARLDVTDLGSIDAALGECVERFGPPQVLVNNAGYGGQAMFEQVSDADVRAMYETNVFGLMNVSRAVLPHMRSHRDGCIVNVSSMAGMMAAPLISVYASSKHAVQGLTEGMAFEYRPLGIKVCSVLPGAYQSTRFDRNVHDSVGQGPPELSPYAQTLQAHLSAVADQMAQQSGQASDPQEVADKIYECATEDTPVHNPIGADATMLVEMMGADRRQDFLDQLAGMVMPQAR